MLSGISFMRIKLVVLGELLFMGFIIIIVIVFISVPAVVISTVSIIWTILVIEIRLTVSLFFVVSAEECFFFSFSSVSSLFIFFKSFINPMFRAVRNRMPMITAIVAEAGIISPSFYIGVFKGARVNSANFVISY